MDIEFLKNFILPKLSIIYIIVMLLLIRKFKLITNPIKIIIATSSMVFVFNYFVLCNSLKYSLIETLCLTLIANIPFSKNTFKRKFPNEKI